MACRRCSVCELNLPISEYVCGVCKSKTALVKDAMPDHPDELKVLKFEAHCRLKRPKPLEGEALLAALRAEKQTSAADAMERVLRAVDEAAMLAHIPTLESHPDR